MYSQNNEEKVILEYFGNYKGTLIDIGANDGKTFSNSLALIERGWNATLVEPSPECVARIRELHKNNFGVQVFQVALGPETKEMEFHESGSLVTQEDVSLVSTLIPKEKVRWEPLNMQWKNYPVKVFTWNDFYDGKTKYDFINIDAEGFDYEILSQMDLKELGCRLICVEHNSIETQKYIDYIAKWGYRMLYQTGENIIMGI